MRNIFKNALPLGFALLVPFATQALAADPGHLVAQNSGGTLMLDAFNDTPPENHQWVTGVSLALSASMTDIQSPEGWKMSTDHQTYVNWFVDMPSDAGNPSTLSRKAIAPGNHLSGFSVKAAGRNSLHYDYGMNFWDYKSDGPNSRATKATPAANAASSRWSETAPA